MIMLSALHSESIEGVGWLEPFVQDFKVRFTTLLAGAYRCFAPALALSILDPKLTFSDAQEAAAQDLALHKADNSSLTPYDFKRLQVDPSSGCENLRALLWCMTICTGSCSFTENTIWQQLCSADDVRHLVKFCMCCGICLAFLH